MTVRHSARALAGLLLLGIGSFLALGDGFVAMWRLAAHGERDIAARAPFIFGMMAPGVAVAVAAILIGTSIMAGRRLGLATWARVVLPVLATLLVVALLFLDPTATLWRVLRPLRRNLVGVVVVDAALIAVSVWLLRGRAARPTTLVASGVESPAS